ncbi:MAG: hypothetical protein IJ375_02830, partial [Oscillospiraceae bacterium]|nr:hypothetical protein [Oscillospiraceae bacterium]
MKTTKRLLAMVLALCMICSLATPALAAEAGSYGMDYDTPLALGENNLTLLTEVETTVYEFCPDETGVYTITSDGAAEIGLCTGSAFWYSLPTEYVTSSVTGNITSVGQSIIVAVKGVESCTLTVAKSGEYEDTTIKPTTYVNTHTPSSDNVNWCSVDGATVGDDLVLGNDGFYYYNDKLVVVNFAHSSISITGMLGSGGARYYEYDADGNVVAAYDYTNALLEYTAIGNYYPMTNDLYEIIPNVCEAQGWVEYGWLTSWRDLCDTVTAHVEGEAVVENGYSNVYCTTCNKLLNSEEYIVDVSAEGASIEAAAGETVKCNLCFNGTLNMTVSGQGDFTVVYGETEYAAENGVVTINGVSSSFWSLATMQIVNESEAAATYAVSFAEPAGSMNNPAELVIGENTAEIEAGSQGYYYTWTAEEAGTLSITMPEGGWFYVINNLTAGTYGDSQWSDSDPVVNPGVVEVAAGDEIQVTVNTYDPADTWNTPAGTLVITAAFKAAADCDHANVEHVEESCYNTEYWYCADCESYWADADLVVMTNSKNVIKAEATHELEAVAESCYNTAYWYCSVCETYWADEALTQITNSKNVIKAEATHELEAVAESCYNTAYWYCSVCETYWADEALTQITNSKNVIKAEATHELEAVAESCYNTAYWYCS